MYCMRKLRSDVLVTLYNAVISSSIMFGSACWGGHISKLDKERLEKIVKICWTDMGGKRLASVSGVPCLSKEGWRGIWLLVESRWDMYGISMCRRFMCVFSVYRLLIENGRGTFCLRWG